MGHGFTVLQVGALPPDAATLLRSRFTVCEEGRHVEWDAVGGIATTGKVEIDRTLLERLPNLRIISCLGAGCEGVDAAASAQRGVEIATTSAVLAADVADIAMALILSMARDMTGADRFVRAGAWTQGRYPLGTALADARLGIVGLGNIGTALGRRAEAFGMRIAYHTRSARADISWTYRADLKEMAEESRFLALCCPGGAATYRLVSAEILGALGPQGYLINVSRGSVVDEAALVEALETGTIAGAGLDVFENEPRPHPGLVASPRTTLLPHIGSATRETRQKMAEAMVEALERHVSAKA